MTTLFTLYVVAILTRDPLPMAAAFPLGGAAATAGAAIGGAATAGILGKVLIDKKKKNNDLGLDSFEAGIDISSRTCEMYEQSRTKSYARLCDMMKVFERAHKTRNDAQNVPQIYVSQTMCKIVRVILLTASKYYTSKEKGVFHINQGSWSGVRKKRYRYALGVSVYFTVLRKECDRIYELYGETRDTDPAQEELKKLKDLSNVNLQESKTMSWSRVKRLFGGKGTKDDDASSDDSDINNDEDLEDDEGDADTNVDDEVDGSDTDPGSEQDSGNNGAQQDDGSPNDESTPPKSGLSSMVKNKGKDSS